MGQREQYIIVIAIFLLVVSLANGLYLKRSQCENEVLRSCPGALRHLLDDSGYLQLLPDRAQTLAADMLLRNIDRATIVRSLFPVFNTPEFVLQQCDSLSIHVRLATDHRFECYICISQSSVSMRLEVSPDAHIIWQEYFRNPEGDHQNVGPTSLEIPSQLDYASFCNGIMDIVYGLTEQTDDESSEDLIQDQRKRSMDLFHQHFAEWREESAEMLTYQSGPFNDPKLVITAIEQRMDDKTFWIILDGLLTAGIAWTFTPPDPDTIGIPEEHRSLIMHFLCQINGLKADKARDPTGFYIVAHKVGQYAVLLQLIDDLQSEAAEAIYGVRNPISVLIWHGAEFLVRQPSSPALTTQTP